MSTAYDPMNLLAPSPPMGWNSYNAFGGMHGLPADADPNLPGGVALSERLVMQTADALVESGLRDAGYIYLNLDDRWQDPRQPRDHFGRLRYDQRRFPRGIAPIADEVHDRGLRFGIYTIANILACGGEEGTGPGGVPRTGSLGHEAEDAELFAEWGVDFLKIDWCGADAARTRGQAAEIFATWNDAIGNTGRDIILSASTWGQEQEDKWAHKLAHMWRTTDDLHPTWESIRKVAAANSEKRWVSISGATTGWNDPDMMHVGHTSLTFEESRTHFVLWAMMSAPLIAGNDLRTMSAEIRDLLTSQPLITIDRDTSTPASVTALDGNWDVWRRTLADGTKATAIVNGDDIARPLPGRLQTGQLDHLTATAEAIPIAPHGVRLVVS